MNSNMYYITVIFLFYSDDGEREDSDNDTTPKKSGREYRDTLDNINQIGKTTTQISIPSTNTSPARTTRPIKKVDLGAAANYGKEQSNVSLRNENFALLLQILFYQFSLSIIFCSANSNVSIIM